MRPIDEMEIVGAMLLDQWCFRRGLELFKTGRFEDPGARWVFEAMVAANSNDVICVREEMNSNRPTDCDLSASKVLSSAMSACPNWATMVFVVSAYPPRRNVPLGHTIVDPVTGRWKCDVCGADGGPQCQE